METIVKSKDVILQEILDDIKTDSYSGVAYYENSVPYDIFINPLTGQTFDTNILADFVKRCISFSELQNISLNPSYKDLLRYALNLTYDEVTQLISLAIDNLALNYGGARKNAVNSVGYIRIYFNKSTAINVSQAILFSTEDGVQFQTKNYFNNFTPYYDSGEALYYVDAYIEAIIAGKSGNVEAGRIIKINTTFPNIAKAVNRERTKFGKDAETDLEFTDRMLSTLRSRDSNVLGGIIENVLTYPNILDVSLVLPNDIDQNRYQKNAVDVYIISDERLQIKEDTFNINSARYAWERIGNEIDFEIAPLSIDSNVYFKCLSQPVAYINSVSACDTPDGTYTTISGDLVKDYTGAFATSSKGNDYVSIPESFLSGYNYVKINYNYDRTFIDLQNYIRNYKNYIVGGDILFKKGTEKLITISVAFKTLQGYDTDTVQNIIISDLTIFFEGGIDSNGINRLMFKLGQSFDLSDVQRIILDTEGVDYIDLDSFKVYIDGAEITSDTYTPSFSQYIRVGNVSFTSLGNYTTINEITKANTVNAKNFNTIVIPEQTQD